MLVKSVDSYPEWIPRILVREMASYQQLEQPVTDSEQAALERLLCAHDMQRVWRSLSEKCQEKGVNFEDFSRGVWTEICSADHVVRTTNETPSNRKKTLQDASKVLRKLTQMFERNIEMGCEANYVFSELIADKLKTPGRDAGAVHDLLYDSYNAWRQALNEERKPSAPTAYEALGAALTVSLIEAMELMAKSLDALQTQPQEVKHVGKPLPVILRRLNRLFVATFGQPLDETVAEIVNTALALPPTKLLDRTAVRAYTDKKSA